jgi:hypothetical protein
VEKTVEWAGVYEQRESQVTFLELEIVHNGAIVRGWVHQTVPRSGRALLLLRSLHSPSRAAAISALSADRAAATAAKAAAAAEEEDSGRYPDLIASLHAKRQEMAREVMLAERVSEAERETERVEMRRVLAKLREEVATLRRTKVEALVAHQQAEAAHARTEGHLRETVRKLTDAHAAIDDVRGQLVESATAHAAHRETSAERAAEHEAGRTASPERHRSTEAHLESSLAQLAEAKGPGGLEHTAWRDHDSTKLIPRGQDIHGHIVVKNHEELVAHLEHCAQLGKIGCPGAAGTVEHPRAVCHVAMAQVVQDGHGRAAQLGREREVSHKRGERHRRGGGVARAGCARLPATRHGRRRDVGRGADAAWRHPAPLRCGHGVTP